MKNNIDLWALIGASQHQTEISQISFLENIFRQINFEGLRKLCLDIIQNMKQAYSKEMWKICLIVNGGFEDGVLQDFITWAILKGEDFFYTFLNQPVETLLSLNIDKELKPELLCVGILGLILDYIEIKSGQQWDDGVLADEYEKLVNMEYCFAKEVGREAEYFKNEYFLLYEKFYVSYKSRVEQYMKKKYS